jgi:hypothetical protein
LSSETSAACVYWAIISPESTPGVVGQERRQAVAASGVEEPVRAALGDARDVGGDDREEVEDVASGAPWKLPLDSMRSSRVTTGLSIAAASSAAGDRPRVVDGVARAPVHGGRAAQRVGVWTRVSSAAVAGDERAVGHRARRVRRRPVWPDAGATRGGPAAKTRPCRAGPRRSSPPDVRGREQRAQVVIASASMPTSRPCR